MEVPMLITDFLTRARRLYPDKVAIVDGDERFTYRQLQERVDRLSNALLDLGLERGDRVCILSPNSHYFLESFYATAQVGLILVPLNYRLVAADHEYILNHAGVSAVLVDWEYTPVVDEIRERLPSVKHWIVAKPASNVSDGSDASAHRESWTSWDELVRQASANPPPIPEIGENETISINYTSGTTSRPKGVIMTHRNCYLNAYNMIVHLGMRHQDVELWTLPMFHCNGWGGVYALTALGGTHVILRAIDGETIFRLLADEGVTFACMAPAVLRTILDFPDKDRFDVATSPRFTVAGAPPPAAFIERLEKELGWEFIQLYGLTETAPLLTISRPDDNTEREDWARRSRAGVAGIGVDLKVLDGDGKPVAKDNKAIGEICARSNVVFAGYYEQPEQTADAIYDGYFHTGDLAVWDEVENIHIVDRKKDVIISGGENISSPEIEDCLYQNSAVLECAVIGIPDEKWGETPVALVVLREGSQTSEADLITFCRDRMAHFKCPTSIRFVEELPRTATGKLQKFKLRETFWGDSDRRIN
jgi:fatty-acyl-CoA synthase